MCYKCKTVREPGITLLGYPPIFGITNRSSPSWILHTKNTVVMECVTNRPSLLSTNHTKFMAVLQAGSYYINVSFQRITDNFQQV